MHFSHGVLTELANGNKQPALDIIASLKKEVDEYKVTPQPVVNQTKLQRLRLVTNEAESLFHCLKQLEGDYKAFGRNKSLEGDIRVLLWPEDVFQDTELEQMIPKFVDLKDAGREIIGDLLRKD